jgi:hypothetical protein
MWPFGRRLRETEPRTSNTEHRLLESQLANTMKYGWQGLDRRSAREALLHSLDLQGDEVGRVVQRSVG